jgi:hypothetical protein
MSLTKGRLALLVLALVLLVAVLAVLAPTLNADRMRQPLADALKQALGRGVAFGEVHYQVFPTLGLSAADLVIPDDPEFGREPLAYVGELQAGIGWSSFFAGELRIKTVRMVDASVNLAHRDEVGWNFSRLLERMTAGVRSGGSPPRLEMRTGRVNFRAGRLKSAFFLNAVDLDLQPPDQTAGVGWSFEASPARTDRAEQGFGRFTGSGKWTPGGSSGGRLQVDMELEPSAVSEVLTLLTGRDLGVQGRFASRVNLDGPLNDVTIKGVTELQSISRPSFFGLRGSGWSLPFEGKLNLDDQSLEFATGAPRAKETLPFSIRLSSRNILTAPSWEAAFQFDGLPAGALLDLSRRLGRRAPEDLKLDGKVVGTISCGSGKPVEGVVEFRDAHVALGGAGPIALETAQVTLEGMNAHLAPTWIQAPGDIAALVSGSWDMESESLEFSVDSQSLPVEGLKGALERLNSVPLPPLMGSCAKGTLSGGLRYARAGVGAPAPTWSGEAQLRELECEVEGIEGPVQIGAATLAIKPGQWAVRKMAVKAAGWEASGDLTVIPLAPRPVRFALTTKALEGADVDRLFAPALAPHRSFLDRTLRRGRQPIPAWLRARRAEGTLRIGALHVGGESFEDVVARVYWDGPDVEFSDLTARLEDSAVGGRMSLRLGGDRLSYRILGRASGLEWKGGEVDAEFELQTPQLASPLAGVIRASGYFSARNLKLGDDQIREAAGCFDYDGERVQQALKLGCLEAQIGGEWLFGQGVSGVEGQLTVDLSGPRHVLRLGGSLSPLMLEPVPTDSLRAR